MVGDKNKVIIREVLFRRLSDDMDRIIKDERENGADYTRQAKVEWNALYDATHALMASWRVVIPTRFAPYDIPVAVDKVDRMMNGRTAFMKRRHRITNGGSNGKD